MFRIATATISLLSFGVSVSAQQTHLVPDDFATIQGAIDAANDGDIVLVDPVVGSSPGFSIDKSLLVYGLGDGFDQVNIDGSIVVENLPPQSQVTVANFDVATSFIEQSTVQNCEGSVYFDHIEFVHTAIALQMTDARDVSLTNCNVILFGQLGSPFATTPSIRMFSSNARFDNCEVRGGENELFNIGLDAAAIHDSFVLISNSTFRGGDAPTSSGVGGTGLTLFVGSEAMVVGAAEDGLIGGSAGDDGTDGFAADVCVDCALSYNNVSVENINDLSGMVNDDPNLPYLVVDGNLVPGGNVSMDVFTGFPSTRGFLLFGTTSQFNPSFHLPLVILGPGNLRFLPFPTDANGNIQLELGIPNDAALQGLRFITQGGIFSPEGIFLSNGADRLITGF